MGDNRRIFCAEESQVIFMDTLPQGLEHNFLLLVCGLHIVTSFKRQYYGKGREKV